MEDQYAQRSPVSRTGAVLTTLNRKEDISPTTPCTADLENEDVTAWSFFSNLRRLVRTAREEVYGGAERRTKRMRVPARDEQPAVQPRQAAATTSAIIIDNSTGVAQVTVTVAASDTPSSYAAAATSDAVSTPVAPAATTTDVAAASSVSSSYAVASTLGTGTGTTVDTAAASTAFASASASLSVSGSALSLSISNSSSITSSLFATTSSSAASSTSSTSFFTSPTVPAYTSSFIIIDSTSSESAFTSTALSTSTSSTTFAVVTSTSASSTETETIFSSGSASGTGASYTDSVASATATGANGLGGSATSTGGAAATSTGTTSDSGSGLTTSQQEIVGGVVGGLAGMAFILVGMLFILRWYKRTMNERAGQQALPSSESGGSPEMSSAAPATAYTQSSAYASHRSQPSTSTTAPLAASAVTPAFFTKKWRNSAQTTSTADTGSTGFQKISGRKIPSVLEHGGDGYGTGYTDPRAGSLAGSSFYRDGEGFYGGPGPHNASTIGSTDVGSPTSLYKPDTPTYQRPTTASSPSRIPTFPNPPGSSHGSPAVLSPVAGVFPSLAGASALQNRGSTASEIAVIRPSPARTPTVQYDAPSGSNTPLRSPDAPPAMPRHSPGNLNATPRFAPGSTAGSVAGSDGIGRSHYDGSRESRFSERLTPTP